MDKGHGWSYNHVELLLQCHVSVAEKEPSRHGHHRCIASCQLHEKTVPVHVNG